MAKRKVYVWIGDDGDNQSVCIGRKVYTKGKVIPAGDADPGVLAAWIKSGLVSEDGQRIVSVVDTELHAEVKALKKDNANLKGSLDKARSGNKAKSVKALEADVDKAVERAEAAEAKVEECEKVGLDRGAKIDELEADVEEKAALIEKHAERITELEAEVEALTEPSTGDGDTGGAGPGGG